MCNMLHIYIKKFILNKYVICDYLSWNLHHHQELTLVKYSLYKLVWNM